MVFIDKSQAIGMVRRIFRNLYNSSHDTIHKGEGMSHRKMCKDIKKVCKNSSRCVFIAERYPDSKNWQVVWGQWSLFTTSASIGYASTPLDQYDKLAFDLTINTRVQSSYKTFYIVLSKHALLRLIMRSQTAIKNSHELNNFLGKITLKLVFASLALAEEAGATQSNTEGFIVIDGLYLPLVFQTAFNKNFQRASCCVVKTLMPEHYESAVKSLQDSDPINPKSDFFDYSQLFKALNQ